MPDLSPVPPPDFRPASRPPGRANSPKSDQPEIASLETAGPRKLIRPPFSPQAHNRGNFARLGSVVLTPSQESLRNAAGGGRRSSHAESLYLQKQMQAQTPMVFVLEGGERIEGYVEWYDRNVIKVRNRSRTLIYKSSIKYLYKAGEEDRG